MTSTRTGYADYHRPQLAAFAEAGADLATAYTLTTVAEAVGIVRAGQDVGLPVAISYTVETDGRLPDGTALGDAIEQLDAATGLGCRARAGQLRAPRPRLARDRRRVHRGLVASQACG